MPLPLLRQALIWISGGLIAAIVVVMSTGIAGELQPSSWLARNVPGAGPSLVAGATKSLIRAADVTKPDAVRRLTSSDLSNARLAVSSEPYRFQPLALIAMAEDMRGDNETARKKFDLIASLNMREPFTLAWLASDNARRGDMKATVQTVDQLLVVHPNLRVIYAPVLVQALVEPSIQSEMRAALSRKPSWELEFWRKSITMRANLPQLHNLRISLQRDPTPVQIALDVALLRALVDEKQFPLANSLERKLSPKKSRADYLRNGDFSEESRYPPFDWEAIQGSDQGAAIDSANSLLLISSVTQKSALVARQLLTMPPGQYQLTVTLKAPAEPQAFPKFNFICADGKGSASLSQRPIISPDKSEAILSVGSACPWQWLHISNGATEQGDGLDIAIDQVRINRLS